MDEMKQLNRQLKNLKAMEGKLHQYPVQPGYSSIFAESFLDFVRFRDELPSVPEGYELRTLRWNDGYLGYLELLSQLDETAEITLDMYSRSVKRIVASATLFLEFKFTHEAGYFGRIGDVVVDKTVLDLFLPEILCQYLASLARHIGVFKLLLECNVDMISCYEELGFKKDTRNISLSQSFKENRQIEII
uniref:Glucosamine 6-phosphate N-acetyltransferase n=1 Tax=Onchocerca volvulus TaxID=6282 RepID=A0A2K6W7M0_ONCVO